MNEIVRVKLNRPATAVRNYDIRIGRGLLANCGEWARASLPAAAAAAARRKIVIVSNRKVFGLYGAAAVVGLEKAGFEVSAWLAGDGERYKNFRSLEKALSFFAEKKLTRTDAVVALGGGVVGDLAGHAAAVYLRGIAFLQIPTTLLAMIDSSVGGKTAVNSAFGKNLIGSFYQPRGVLIDTETLKTLPRRELTAGWCEAVKQGAIASRELFRQTAGFLVSYPVKPFRRHFANPKFDRDLTALLAAQIAFKASVVAGDETENPLRTDARSRKILNFGHTVAHALEKVTAYRRFKHGEAVGYGMLVAGEVSKVVANFDQNELKSLNDVVRLTGNLPSTKGIETDEVLRAFAFDKKQTGEDALQWILLRAVGKPVILPSADIPREVVKKSIEKILGQ